MLTRSAGGRQQKHTARLLDACFAQLNLPWLAPAQVRWRASQSLERSRPPVRSRQRNSIHRQQVLPQARHLATAIDQYTARIPAHYDPPPFNNAFRNAAQDQNIPWDPSKSSEVRLSSIRPYDDPIIINTSIQNPAQTIKVSHGVQGTALELLQHLHTALQVGRLQRAESIIQRLGELCSSESAELLHAHTAYLEESLRALALQGRGDQGQKILEEMQRWFEVEIRRKGVSVDAKLIVIMIRASIRALSGPKRARTLRRYADMARQLGGDIYDEVLESDDYDDNEYTILGRLTYDETSDFQPQDGMESNTTPEEAPVQIQRQDLLSADQLPEVLPTQQRGEGLTGIKRAMRAFMEQPSLPSDVPVDQHLEQAMKRQKAMEETSVEIAVDRWRHADEELRKIGIHTSMQSKPIGALMWQWYQALVPALEAELAECRKLLSDPGPRDHDRYHYGPSLELLPLDKIAANTILFTMVKMTGKHRDNEKERHQLELKMTPLTLGLAKSIEQECSVITAKHKRSSRMKAGSHNSSNRSLKRHFRPDDIAKKGAKAAEQRKELLAQLEWSMDVKVKFGAMLTTKLMETAQLPVTRAHPRTKEKITQMQPAFLHRFSYEKGKKIGMLTPNPALIEKIESEPLGSLIAKRMPMVVEPKPWTSWSKGGYLHYSNPILRLPAGDQSGKDYFLAAYDRGDMSQIFAGLTALGEVPWKIHHGVFKVQLEAWNSGEDVANLAPLHPELDMPHGTEPSSDPNARHKWLLEMRDAENKRTGLHSKRCFQNFQLEIARSMVNETLYFPHNMDFRGRSYPMPPYLNHMGADNVRGLLVFAKGKELGHDGLRWLKIHLATVAGHDKASMSERLQFTEKHLNDIYDSVRNPLGGRRWWLKSEDAWQTLAACFELAEALDSPDATKFVSHLPIQQDGTCNGLQHYAALGGDKIGAAQVNLEPGDRPADVYTAVAEAVKLDVRQDALQGNPVAQKLDGRLTRKCVKQPVMTNVYGVTWFGAKEQVQRQLEVIFPEVRKFDEVNHANMSQYIATKIFKSLGTMFGGAQAIQHWLGQCADRISTCLTPEQITELSSPPKPIKEAKKKTGRQKKTTTSTLVTNTNGSAVSDTKQQNSAKPLFKSTVVWTTPLRLPVVQPYRSMSHRIVNTSLQAISLQEPRAWHPVSKRKQLQAFPPNFIHSLDATHMMLSALRCKEMGITFASVHDSFWTHACDVDRMSVALRDSFVEMHSDNIVERLREEFQARYKGCMYLASVFAKSPVGQKIVELRKLRKKDVRNELALEAERMQLLASKDPNNRAKGEAMVTPGSIMAAEGDESAFAISAELHNHQLGMMPESAGLATNADADEISESAEFEILNASHETTADSDEGVVVNSVLATPTEALLEADPPTQSEESTGQKVKKASKQKKVYHRKLFVWLPLEFPAVPPKGEFDVRKIRNSPYFFH